MAYKVLVYIGGWELTNIGVYDDFDDAQNALENAKNDYLQDVDGEDMIEEEEENFYFNSRIEEIEEEEIEIEEGKEEEEEEEEDIVNGLEGRDYIIQAAFENACDCLYYGYGKGAWNSLDLTEEERKDVWNKAKEHLCEEN